MELLGCYGIGLKIALGHNFLSTQKGYQEKKNTEDLL